MPGIPFPRTSILKSSWWGCPPSVKFFSKILYPPGYHIIMLIKLRAVKLWIKYVNEQKKIFRSLTAYYSLGLLLHQFHLMSVLYIYIFVLGLRLTNLLKFPFHGTRTKRKKLNNCSSSSLRRHFFDYFFSCGKSDRIRFLSHYIEGIWKRSFISPARPGVHTNPLQKRSFSKTPFEPEEIETPTSRSLASTEIILKSKLFTNDDVTL